MSFNKFIGVGNLARDVELRYTQKGMAVANTSLAMNHTWKNEAGDQKETCCFLDVKLWGRMAETTAQYCSKGSKVLIEGRLEQESWQDKTTGQNRSKIVVVGESVQFLGTKKDDPEPQQKPAPRNAPQGGNEIQEPDDSEDVPF